MKRLNPNTKVIGKDKKEYTVQDIKDLLLTNDKAVGRAIYRIFEYQTMQEQSTEATLNNNGVGFTGADAKVMTGMAKFYGKTGFLTEKQIKWVRHRVIKYAGQLHRIMNGAQ